MNKDSRTNRPEMIACGILRREINYLIKKNRWPVTPTFLDSSLHIDFDKLSRVLTRSLSKKDPFEKKLVVYGTCHPKMDDMLGKANAVRTPGQNCVELILGRERFTTELSKGAFFLFEDWARRWETISYNYFGSWQVMKQIFQDAHKYILCIRTPCSNEFETSAEQVGRRLGLPLLWEDFELDRLESTLKKSIDTVIEDSKDG